MGFWCIIALGAFIDVDNYAKVDVKLPMIMPGYASMFQILLFTCAPSKVPFYLRVYRATV